MSRIINELVGAFQDEVDKRSRGGSLIWAAVYDDLAGRRGDSTPPGACRRMRCGGGVTGSWPPRFVPARVPDPRMLRG